MASREKNQPGKRDGTVKSGASEFAERFKAHPFLFTGTVVILVIVIVAFVFVPAIVPSDLGGGELLFGYYNKVPIKYVPNNYFNQVLQSLANEHQVSQDDPNYIYTAAMIWRGAFEETAVYLGILDEMKQAGFRAPEDVVDREVAELSVFQENGRFSAAKYRALSNNEKLNVWRQVQESIAVINYKADIEGLRMASGEASFIASMSSPRRTFDIAVFPLSSYPDSEVIAYASANPGLFRVTRLSRITVASSERDARQVLDSVKNGVTTFEEAAQANSQDSYASQSGDMGVKMAYELVYEITGGEDRELVINLPQGGISDLVQVPGGWAFFRAEEAARPADTGDAAYLEKIRSYIMTNLRGQAEDWLIAGAEKFAAGVKETDFAAAASGAGITGQRLGPLPVNYGNSALFTSVASSGIPGLSSAGTNQLFWETAFNTPLNTPSAPIVTGDSVIVIFPLEENTVDENELRMVESYYPYWLSELNREQLYRSYFLNNGKLEDRFEETFWTLWTTN